LVPRDLSNLVAGYNIGDLSAYIETTDLNFVAYDFSLMDNFLAESKNSLQNMGLGAEGISSQTGIQVENPGGPPVQLRTAEHITRSAVSAIDHVNGIYDFETAACNIGVACAFRTLTGSNSLDNKTANQIVQHISTSAEWKPVVMSSVQTGANSGHIILGGTINPIANKSGHIIMIVPGQEVDSFNWNGLVPQGMDAGKKKKWSKNGINESWTYPDGVKFYKYMGN